MAHVNQKNEAIKKAFPLYNNNTDGKALIFMSYKQIQPTIIFQCL